MGNLGPFEIAILAAVGLILFGGRLPEVARSLGRAINEFKRGMVEEPPKTAAPDHSPSDDAPPPTTPTPALPSAPAVIPPPPYDGKEPTEEPKENPPAEAGIGGNA